MTSQERKAKLSFSERLESVSKLCVAVCLSPDTPLMSTIADEKIYMPSEFLLTEFPILKQILQLRMLNLKG